MKKLFITFNLIFSLATFAQVPNYIPTMGLLGYWPFNGNANDQSGNLNNGTVSGATLSLDRFSNPNSAYSFNGTSDYILVPNNPSFSGFNDITISAWVNTSQLTGIQAIVAKWYFALSCGSNTDNYNASFASNMLVFATNNNNMTGCASTYTFGSGDLNTWKHFVFVSKASQGISIYINGVLSGTCAAVGNICSSTNPLYFGAVNPTFRFFKGKLDDIGIWNRQLTNCEIMKLYTGSITTLTATSSNSVLCVGNSASLTVSGANTYTWSNSSTNSVTIVSPTITTNYTVTGTNTLTGCTNTTAITQVVSACAGIQDSELNNPISIYPNPVSDNLNLSFNGNAKNNVIVYLEDCTGKQLLQQTITSENTNHTLKMNKFEDGIYILKITTVDGSYIKTKKIVISR